ncbi:GNAT family N-acetyltransferase [Erysipelothrix sp. HDW6C]|uniref:GNAT family N-acetyltransferase n=1 Tax=Erysipelothrix sp. HDW6C TaxID=2714930 RepID=UPI00140D56B9|nr:GNAT family N-acetyltransferase [Erysipelothrix sp. HDW6C]QIK69118.1 GNAT family N-acetyltransferase [Erysipelothrix sp. HDW6C]
MIKLDKKRAIVLDLLNTVPLLHVKAYVEGGQGEGWIEPSKNPKTAVVNIDILSFLGGEASSNITGELLKQLPQPEDTDWIIVFPQTDSWKTTIEQAFEGRLHKMQRHAMKKDTQFSISKLESMINSVSQQHKIEQLDESAYEAILASATMQDLVNKDDTKENTLSMGKGFVVRDGDRVVCGACSFLRTKDQIEVQIITDPDYQRQGLATACGAALILDCIKDNIHPSWDAANPESLRLAEKLGYEHDYGYDAYALKIR